MFRLSRALDFPFQKDKHYTRFVLAGFMKNPSINCDMHQHVESGCQSFPDALLSLTEQYLENGIVPHRGSYQWKIVLNDINDYYGGIESDKFEIGGIAWILKAKRYMYKSLSVMLHPYHAPDEFVNVEACAKLCFVETNDFFVYPFDLNFDGFALDHRIDLSEIENPIYLTVLIHIQILRIQNSDSLIFNYSNWPSTAHTFKWAIDEPLIKKIISCHNKLRTIFTVSEHNVYIYSPIFNNFWNVYINCKSLSIHCQACAFPKNRVLSAMYTEGGTVLTAQFPNTRIFGKIYIEELDIQCTFDENVFLIEQLKQLKQLTIHFCDIRIEILKERENKSQKVKKYQVYLENMKTIKEVENSSNKRIIKKSRKRKYEEMNDIHQIPMNNSDTKRIKLQLTLTKQ
eukprot:486845_1